MANSKTHEIQDALLALWQALTVPAGALEGVRVNDQWDTSGESLDQLMVGKAKAEREFAAMGANPVPNYETVTVTCGAGAIRQDGKQAARDRLDAILDAAEQAIRDEHTLGIDGVMWARVSEIERGLTRTDNSPAAEASFKVEAKTRIYP